MQVREKEELAEQIKRNGLAESKRIINEANEKAAALIHIAQKEADDFSKETLAKASEASLDDYETMIHKAMTECRLIEEGANGRMDKAASFLVEWMVNEWQS